MDQTAQAYERLLDKFVRWAGTEEDVLATTTTPPANGVAAPSVLG